MNSKHIQDKLEILFSNHSHLFLNKYIFDSDWESDFFSVTSSGYLYEVEVKISKSDFAADFIKFKHKIFEGRNQTEVIKEAKYKYSKRWKKDVRRAPEKKINPQEVKMPNKFFFACPDGLLKVEDIPEYAGLIYVTDTAATIIKHAPLLHKRKENIKELLFSKYQWGYINTKNDLDVLDKKFEDLCRGLEKRFELPDGSVNSLSSLNKLLKNKPKV